MLLALQFSILPAFSVIQDFLFILFQEKNKKREIH